MYIFTDSQTYALLKNAYVGRVLRIYLFAGKDVSPAQLSSVVVVKIRVLDDRERRKVNVKAILILNLIHSFLLCELPGEAG